MKKLNFLRGQKILTKLKQKTTFAFNVFCYENKLIFPIYISEQRFENAMEFLLLFDGDRSHYVYIKDFDRFIFHKTKNKNKKRFCGSCLQCFSRESVLIKHKENCLSINGKQSVKLEKGIIEFENYFKQIPVPFKIYVDFECNLRGVESYEGSYTNNIKITFLVVLLIKFFVLMIDLLSELLLVEVKMQLMNLLKQILKEYKYCRKVINQHFNRNLIMREEEKNFFQHLFIYVKTLLIVMKKKLEIISQ